MKTKWKPSSESTLGFGSFNALPGDVALIHPAMPLCFGGRLVEFCRRVGINPWDRKDVYDFIATHQPKPQ